MKVETFLEKFELFANAPGGLAKMRELIFHLAVTGRLSGPEEGDPPVDELIEAIAAGKASRLNDRKRSAAPFSIECPIDIPNHWAWLPLNGIGEISGGMTPSKNKATFWDGEVNWFSSKDIKTDELVESELKITDEAVRSTRLQVFQPGCLVMVARSGILKRTFPVSILRTEGTVNQDLKVLSPFVGGLERYLQIMFRGMTDFILSSLVKTGMTVQSLKYEEFEAQPFPLPPLAEQKRIVARVDELLALCDRQQAQQQEREIRRGELARASLARFAKAPIPTNLQFLFHKSYAISPTDLHKSILTLAVRGKLVPQDPNDEPAATLLGNIAAEKARRLRDGTLRNFKVPDPVPDDDKEFELPFKWEWVRMGQVVKLWNGFAFKSGDFQPTGIPVIRIGDLRDGLVDDSTAVCVSESVAEKMGEEFWIPEGALLLAMSGATTGKVAFNKTGRRLLLNQRVGRLEPILVSSDYVRFFFETIVARNLSMAFGSAIPNLSAEQINATVLPLPPLAEQRRIVAKVDQLMALLSGLETELSKSRALGTNLINATVAELTAAA